MKTIEDTILEEYGDKLSDTEEEILKQSKRKPKKSESKTDWYDLGYRMAKGTKGTGWMAYTKGDYKEGRGETKQEKIDNNAEEWQETLQWNYEVGQDMRDEVGGELTEDTIDDYFDMVLEWNRGYSDYAEKIESKKTKKLKSSKSQLKDNLRPELSKNKRRRKKKLKL